MPIPYERPLTESEVEEARIKGQRVGEESRIMDNTQTVGEAIRAEMIRLNLNQVDAVQLEGRRSLILTQDDPVLAEPLGDRTIRLLHKFSDAEGANDGEVVRIDSPVGYDEESNFGYDEERD
jgi:hypothetical protein